MKRLITKSGFTLVETIIAMVLMIILVTGFASIYAFTSVTTYHAGRTTKTTAGARTETDKMLSIPVDPGAASVPVGIVFNGSGGSLPDTIDTVRETYETPVDADITKTHVRDVEFRIYRKKQP